MNSFDYDVPVEEPVDGKDEGDVVGGQADGVEDHDHGDEAGLRDAGGADGGRRRGDRDRDHVAQGQGDAADLEKKRRNLDYGDNRDSE